MSASAEHRQATSTSPRSVAPNRQVRRFFRTAKHATQSFALTFLLVTAWPADAQSQADEYHIKAAFLFHFAQLVDWPPEALGSGNRPLNFCTVGEQAVPDALESTVMGKQIGPHSINVQHLREGDDPRYCHVLYILLRDKKHVAAILAVLQKTAVLTVGESDDFIQEGGMIGFSLQENKIRFDINLRAAQRVNIKISSRLLLLAKTVVGDPGQG